MRGATLSICCFLEVGVAVLMVGDLITIGEVESDDICPGFGGFQKDCVEVALASGRFQMFQN